MLAMIYARSSTPDDSFQIPQSGPVYCPPLSAHLYYTAQKKLDDEGPWPGLEISTHSSFPLAGLTLVLSALMFSKGIAASEAIIHPHGFLSPQIDSRRPQVHLV